MAFRVKDLMISILPGAGEGPGGFLSRFPCHCGCTYGYTQGCGPTIGGGGTPQALMMAAYGHVCPGEISRTQPPQRCYDFTNWCPPFTIQCEFSQTVHTTPFLTAFSPFCCIPWSTIAGPVGVPPGGDPAAMVEQLAAMKAQLREAIAQIENQEKVVGELAQPQSIAEIEELEAKLKGALNELEHRKSELKKKP